MTNIEHQIVKVERLSAIAERIGYALWQLQELEGITAQYYVLVAQATRGMGLEAGLALTDKALSKTFGSTVSNLIKAKHLPGEVEARFQAILAERNWLVHNSRASNRSAVHDDAACQTLLLRVNRIADEALSLLKEVGMRAEAFVRSSGVSMQEIERIAEETLHVWHNQDAI